MIAYDRLIRDSANVDYYATFDNYKVGVQQATALLAGLGLTDLEGAKAADAPAGPFNIELFAGSPDDNNATFFFNGAMDMLKPFIDDGTLVVKSGQTDIEQVATLRWDPADGPEAHGGPADVRLTPTARALTASCPPTTACPSASCPR